MTTTPYADAAPGYQRAGWSPIPLPARRKAPPPVGWTGYDAPMASGADVAEWASNGHRAGNVGLRLPDTVLGLDLDAYDGKPGMQTTLDALDRLGALPPSVTSTSRADGSGVRFYRVPAGRRWADTLGPGVEVIHHGHRYAVAAPSVHPEGRDYRWIGPNGLPVDGLPVVVDLPNLPVAWVADLDRGSVSERPPKAPVVAGDVAAYLVALPAGEACPYVARLLGEASAALAGSASRHDTARGYVGRMVRAGEQGHHGAGAGLDTLQGLWLDALRRGKVRAPDPGEWSRMMTGAVAMVAANPTLEPDKGCCGVPALTLAPASSTTTPQASTVAHRELRMTAASTITVRPVQWLWSQRIALGTLALLGGREGVGKSTVGYTLAADVTRGRLAGCYQGQPRSVIVAATEDSWAHTIVPRSLAAGADLTRVYRVDVTTAAGVDTGLSLPLDLPALARAVREVDAALILLDPLMSRLASTLDTHKDADVRIALEPLVTLADDTGAAILGLIHVNKSTSTDPLTTLMASRAFAAVARAVLFVMADPDDETTRLLGQPKNNLGRTDLPTLTFTIESAHVADTEEGPVWTSRLRWLGERALSIREALESAADSSEVRTATAEAADWLRRYLTAGGGDNDSATIKQAGVKAGYSVSTLTRARGRLKVVVTTEKAFQRRTFWTLPGTAVQSDQASQANPGESDLSDLTELTGHSDLTVSPVSSVNPLASDPTRDEPTAPAGKWALT